MWFLSFSASRVLLAQNVDIVGLHNTCPPGWLSCRWLFDRYILFPVRGGLQRQLSGRWVEIRMDTSWWCSNDFLFCWSLLFLVMLIISAHTFVLPAL